MAEPKKNRKIVSASTGKQVDSGSVKKATYKKAAPVGNATGLRVGAVILWLLALAFEVAAVLILFKKINLTFLDPLWQIVIALVLDLGCLIGGSLMWKKANDYDPASEKNKVKFWLWNNLGLIVAAFAFVPFIILALTNKNADKKTKTVATVVAVIALLIGGLIGFDWNPASQEDLEAARNQIEGDVFWTKSGGVYHTHEDCYHLDRSEELVVGSVDEAFAANKNRLCKTCAKADEITDVETDDAEDPDGESEPATGEQ